MNSVVGHVAGLWRYPVKSLAGEPMRALRVDQRGVELDRVWGLVDREGGIASGKTTRRFRKVPGLLRHSSHLDGQPVPVITLADGRCARVDSPEAGQLVREIAGPGWSLQREDSVSHFDEGAVHLITTTTVATLSDAAREPISVERLRPNVLLETDATGFPEDEWVGQTLRLGEVGLQIVGRAVRCVMVNHAQPTLRPRRDVLKTIGALNGSYAGVYANVLAPGTIRTGDKCTLLTASRTERQHNDHG
jgi:uncharacterized protein